MRVRPLLGLLGCSVSKDDVEVPDCPPRKKGQLHAALDKWLAVWASDPNLTPSDARRVQEERDRRKAAGPTVVLGVVEAPGGATPEQLQTLERVIVTATPSRVLHPFVSRGVHRACLNVVGDRAAIEVLRASDADREIARRSQVLVGLVNGPSMPLAKVGIWGSLRYAKDRGVDVKIIYPSGSTQEGRWT